MARIKIKDIPKNQKVTEEEMATVIGGRAPAQGQLTPYKPSTAPFDIGQVSFKVEIEGLTTHE